MDGLMKGLGWFLKSKWGQGHRREIGAALTVATTVLTLASGPLGALVPALAAPALHTTLLTAASYFGIVGTLFANDPPTP